MAKTESQEYPWILNTIPLLVLLLIAFHVFALGYWIYRLATDNKTQQLQLQLQQQQQQQQQHQQRTKAH